VEEVDGDTLESPPPPFEAEVDDSNEDEKAKFKGLVALYMMRDKRVE
jgi:hypothetical protein